MRYAYMEKARDYFLRYVERKGGVNALSVDSGIPYPTLACVCNGNRGIGRHLANSLVKYDAKLDMGKLLQVTALQPVRPESRRRA